MYISGRIVDTIFWLMVIKCYAVALAVSENTARIIGGTAAINGLFPYQVSVQLTTVCLSHGHVCGGALISDKHVVTAASCVTEKPGDSTWTAVKPAWFRVQVGNVDLDSTEAAFSVAKINVHPDFNPDTLAHDLAVLQLAEAVGDYGAAAPLADTAPTVGTICNVTGWGIASAEGLTYERNLLWTDVSRLNDSACPTTTFNNTDGMFCAGTTQGDACLGDTGAPLACGGRLAALAAAPGCGDASFYTDLAQHAAWIDGLLSGAASAAPAAPPAPLAIAAAAAALITRRIQSA